MSRRKRKKYPLYERLEILDAGSQGKAIAKKDEIVIFVTEVVPGDVVDVQIKKRKKNYQEGYPVKFHKYSTQRVEAFCKHFGTCGGCKWQNMPYQNQLFYKQKQVKDNLERIGKIQPGEVNEIIPSLNDKYYRNKLEFTFSNQRWLAKEEIGNEQSQESLKGLGFHVPGRFDKIVDIEHCFLQPEPSNAIRLAIKNFAIKHRLSFFDIKNKHGFLRNLIIRNSSSTGEVMVILVFFYEVKKLRENLLRFLKDKFPQITSLMYVINPKMNDTITDLDVKLFAGRDYIIETMENLKFKISPKSFYQTNSEQAFQLYQIVREYAQLSGNEVVYDLYTGTGTIANFVASQARLVTGIEYVPEAIEDARINSSINEINNTRFFAGDMKDIFVSDFISQQGRPDVLIADPPRAGMHKDVIKNILNASPGRIVYVSCNPATQARDIELLSEKYKTTKIQPVDMFPHTHHVENVALLEKMMR